MWTTASPWQRPLWVGSGHGLPTAKRTFQTTPLSQHQTIATGVELPGPPGRSVSRIPLYTIAVAYWFYSGRYCAVNSQPADIIENIPVFQADSCRFESCWARQGLENPCLEGALHHPFG